MKKLIVAGCCVLFILAALFAWNGLQAPIPMHGKTEHPTAPVDSFLTIKAYNLAKCFVFKSDTFKSVQSMEEHLNKIAALIIAEKPDLVFLNEVVGECGPCPVNQVEYLAKKAGFPYWAFGENYSWGLPFYRMRSGNGILSHFPFASLEVVQLTGSKPFYNPTNNRRLLKADIRIAGQALTIASVHNDSYSAGNNLKQTIEILDIVEGKAVLAGDFNADVESPSVQMLQKSGRFVANWDSPPTFPARKPKEAIDFILAPSDWQLISHDVVQSTLSDHFPVVSLFKLKNGD